MGNWEERILTAADKISKGIEKSAEYIVSKTPKQSTDQTGTRQMENPSAESVRHCPSCGYTVSSLNLFCPSCGSSLEDETASSSAQKLADSLNAIDSKKEGIIRNFLRTAQDKVSDKATQKAQMIKSFPVPNNKKDLLEIIHMAASNINVDVLLDAGSSSLDADAYRSEKLLSQTWLDKMEAIYQKAKALLSGDAELYKIEAVYQAKKGEIARVQAELHKKKTKANVLVAVSVAAVVLGLAAIILFGIRSEKAKTDTLEALITEIRQDIKNEDYNAALLKTNKVRLKDGSSEDEMKWDQTRERLITEIEQARDSK